MSASLAKVEASLETLGQRLYESSTGTHGRRRFDVAAALGYMDARTMVRYYETHGLGIVDQALFLAKKYPGIRLDWSGLVYELSRIGKSRRSVDAMLQEAREMLPEGSR